MFITFTWDSVSGFEFTSESGLFDLLDVQLYHGWLVDPQDTDISEVIGQHSYNQLVEMIINGKASDDHEKTRKGKQGYFLHHFYCITHHFLFVYVYHKVMEYTFVDIDC